MAALKNKWLKKFLKKHLSCEAMLLEHILCLICSRGPAFVSNHRQWAEKSLVNMRYAAEPDNIKALY